jgi:hypothetical protein
MPFVGCPSCGVNLDIQDSLLGQKVRCASCSTVFEAQATEASSPLPLNSQPPADAPPRPRDRWAENRFDEREDDDDRRPRYDDDYDDDDEHWQRRRMRRDLLPHRGGLVMGLGIGSAVTGPLGICSYGILSIIGVALGITAWMMGRGDMRQMDKGEMDPDGRGMTQAGLICGIIGTSLGGLMLLACGGIMLLYFGVLLSKK